MLSSWLRKFTIVYRLAIPGPLRRKTRRFSSLWVRRALGRTPWPLTGVRGSESGMARVCENKKLSLKRQ